MTMRKWWIKTCPKCHGDLYEDRFLGDWDIKCLQCGYVLPLEQAKTVAATPSITRRVAAKPSPAQVRRAA